MSKISRSAMRLSLILIVVLVTACGGSGSLVGKWRHLSKPTATPPPTPTSTGNLLGDLAGGLVSGLELEIACDLLYPDTIEFFKDGTYAGQLGSVWGGGKYDIVEKGRIRLETATGISAYDFFLSGNTLTFKDDSGCEFVYQKMP